MITAEKFRELALSLPQATELPHFEKASFRYGTKIFATLSLKEETACVKLTENDQSLFAGANPEVVYPVPNKWGKQGWTIVDLSAIKKDLLKALLLTAYEGVSTPSKSIKNSKNKAK